MKNFRSYLLFLMIGIIFVACKKNDDSPQRNFNLDFANFTPYTPNQTQITKIFYVDQSHPDASNSNVGTEDSPWLTISHAAEIVEPATKIIVKAGTYNEKTIIERGGEANAPIIFETSGEVITYDFRIVGNYISLYGFSIRLNPEFDDWRNSAIFIEGSNVHVANNNIRDFVHKTGVRGSWGDNLSRNVHVSNNYIYRCTQGIGINGYKWYVANNKIERLIKETEAGDADYMRYFGDSIVIKGNYMYGTFEEEIGNAHVDLFQTFDNNHGSAYNILIEGNMGLGMFHQGIMASSTEYRNHHQNLWVIKNVFVNAGSWGLCIYQSQGVHAINNTFFNCKFHGIGFNDGSTGVIKNNLFYGPAYWADENSSMESGYNLIFRTDRDYNESDFTSTDIINRDPMFVNMQNIIGEDGIPFTNDDGLRLREGSPAIGADEDGNNIGAY